MRKINSKIRFLSVIAFLTFAAAITASAQIEKEIAKIRSEVAAVNSGAAKYKKTTKNVEDISLEGTEATYFSDGEEVRKITAKIYGESYNEIAELYYRGGELMFVYVKFNGYAAPIGSSGKSPKITRREEQRFYFAGGELIRLLVGKKELKSAEERYSELKDGIIRLSKALKEA